MRIGVPREVRAGERRVAATPETAKKLVAAGFGVVVESGAGLGSAIDDAAFQAAGATIGSIDDVWSSDIVTKVAPATPEEAARLREGAMLIGFAWPDDHPDVVGILQDRRASLVALELVPRIARAQKMDVLSSMANIAGYRAIIEASQHFGRFFPMLMTAAGSVPPAHVLVIGAGVAGLSAISTAKRLGAVVRAFDTRPAVKDQVKSVGARFLELELEHAEDERGYAKEASAEFLRKEMDLLHRNSRECDIVVTTALVAGKKAPLLITEEMVRDMKRGSVIVDLAAQRGGNCALTRADEVVEVNGVTILGHTNLPSRMAIDASRLYARNLLALLLHLKGKGKDALDVDKNDEIVKGVLLLDQGAPVHPALAARPQVAEATHG